METISRILGSFYAMASGDAMGVPSSFLTPPEIRENWGWIDTFLPPKPGHIFHDGLGAGEYTDDTEQALALTVTFARNHRVVPEDVAAAIMEWAERVKDKYRSPLGPSTARALKAIMEGADIHESGRYGNTNGAAMRIAPVGMIHGMLSLTLDDLVRDVYETCIPTHNTTVCVSSAAAVAAAVCGAMKGLDTDGIVALSIEAAEKGAAYGYPIVSPSIAKRIRFAVDIVRKAGGREEAMAELYDWFGGGDGAADSIPSAIALFVLGNGSVRDTVEAAANLGGDCDTNGAIAGAIAGAMAGEDGVPAEWKKTICSVNHISMEQYARMIEDAAASWKTAGGNT